MYSFSQYPVGAFPLYSRPTWSWVGIFGEEDYGQRIYVLADYIQPTIWVDQLYTITVATCPTVSVRVSQEGILSLSVQETWLHLTVLQANPLVFFSTQI